MNPATLSPTRSVSAALMLGMLLLPFTSLILQEVLLLSRGVQLREGDAIIHLICTGAIAFVGLLLFCGVLYQAYKNRIKLPLLKISTLGAVLAIGFAVVALTMHGTDRFCAGAHGECGRWI
jgi:hypothetical protein